MTVTLSSLSGGKTRYVVTLLSGTSWTVPAGVTYVNVCLVGGAGAGATNVSSAGAGSPGNVTRSVVATTPGASITYAIGAGGDNAAGGTTSFTGAISATGGGKGDVSTPPAASTGSMNTGGQPTGSGSSNPGGVGGNGFAELEYWL